MNLEERSGQSEHEYAKSHPQNGDFLEEHMGQRRRLRRCIQVELTRAQKSGWKPAQKLCDS